MTLAGCTETDGGGGGGDGPTDTPEPEQIVAGTAPGFPPFEITQNGELTGFDVELFEAVVAETDYEFGGWKEFEFDALIPALADEKIDAIAAAMTISEKRDEQIDFSDPYYSADQSIIVREGDGFDPGSLEDLSGNPVGVQKGTTGEGIVKDELVAKGVIRESNYKAYDNYTLAVQDLVNGNIDAIVLDRPVAETFADQRPVVVAFTYETGERYGFTELIRGTPLLAQLFVLYFGIGLTRYIREVPGVGVEPIPDQAVVVALIGFTINSTTYQSEYIRSALLSVDSGQLTAARAISLSQLEGIRYVVLPQGLRYAIPGWSNELVYLIKYSSLAAFITVPELFFRAESIGADSFRYVEVYTLAALFYLAMVLTASAFMGRFEERVSIPGLGTRATR